MKLSNFTTLSNPIKRGDNHYPALNCYQDFAEELVIVNGDGAFDAPTDIDNLPTIIEHSWPKEFDWSFIGEQFQRGYEACTGDWVIHADLDFILHENDYEAIRKACEDNSEAPALSFWKYQFIQPDGYNLKSRLVIAVNKAKYGDRIRFDGGGDLCQPTLDGKELKPDDVPEAKVPIYNYECILKTKAQLLEDKGRFARAWQRQFGEYKLGGPDDQSAYEEWLKMVVGRYSKPRASVPLSDHPKVMQDTIKNLAPEQWGYSGFGAFKENNYV